MHVGVIAPQPVHPGEPYLGHLGNGTRFRPRGYLLTAGLLEPPTDRAACSIVKGEVCQRYTRHTNFPEVLARLNSAFDSLVVPTVHGCIQQANRNLSKLHQDICKEDTLDDGDSCSDGVEEIRENDECSDSSSDNGDKCLGSAGEDD